MSAPRTQATARRVNTGHQRDRCQTRVPGMAPRLLPGAGLAIYLILGLISGSQAAEPSETRRPAKDMEKPAPAEPAPKPKQKAPRSFVPTEKIKADSTISFPVDI